MVIIILTFNKLYFVINKFFGRLQEFKITLTIFKHKCTTMIICSYIDTVYLIVIIQYYLKFERRQKYFSVVYAQWCTYLIL